MFVDTIRIWKEDTGEEFEAETCFFLKDIVSIERYVCDGNFKNNQPKVFISLIDIGSIIVIEDYSDLKKKWKDYYKYQTVQFSPQ